MSDSNSNSNNVPLNTSGRNQSGGRGDSSRSDQGGRGGGGRRNNNRNRGRGSGRGRGGRHNQQHDPRNNPRNNNPSAPINPSTSNPNPNANAPSVVLTRAPDGSTRTSHTNVNVKQTDGGSSGQQSNPSQQNPQQTDDHILIPPTQSVNSFSTPFSAPIGDSLGLSLGLNLNPLSTGIGGLSLGLPGGLGGGFDVIGGTELGGFGGGFGEGRLKELNDDSNVSPQPSPPQPPSPGSSPAGSQPVPAPNADHPITILRRPDQQQQNSQNVQQNVQQQQNQRHSSQDARNQNQSQTQNQQQQNQNQNQTSSQDVRNQNPKSSRQRNPRKENVDNTNADTPESLERRRRQEEQRRERAEANKKKRQDAAKRKKEERRQQKANNKQQNPNLTSNTTKTADESDEEKDEPPPPTTQEQISSVKKVEVSITSSTTTKSRVPSESDLASMDSKRREEEEKKKKKKKKQERVVYEGGNQSQQYIHAQRTFNRQVRLHCETSDLVKVVESLENPMNSDFVLDAPTLEATMKTFVVAAQFEDALKCLKNNTRSDTLDALQTERILASLPQNLRNSSAFTAADMINQLCIATNFKNGQTARAYFLRIVRGIALEFLEEATSARDRICSAHCERLVRTGQCVVDAQLRKGRRETEILVNPGHQLGVFIPEIMDSRGIQAGDAVSILPYAGPYPMSAESLDRNMVEATVTNASPLIIRLHDKTNRQLQKMLCDPAPGNVYRIDKLANRMGFNRQLEAARIVAAPPDQSSNAKKDQQRPSDQLITAITAMDENIDNIMLGAVNGSFNQRSKNVGTTSTAELCAQAVPMDARMDNEEEDSIRAYSRLALDKTGQLDGLNSSQRLAVHQAVTNRLTLVQGPPGTGKTAVAIKIMSHWAKTSNSPVLATSDSNIAVDNLVEGCAKAGLSVVRLGRPEAIRPELLKYCVDKPGNKTDGNDVRTAGIEGLEDGGQFSGLTNNATGAQIFKEKMRTIKKAQIVCCTCIGSGGEILDGMIFERVLVDEATQATEPATLVPLTRGCRQLVLVGDHCQLPPTVLSTKAEEEGLGVPLFSRMVACGVPPCMLDTQYRMHPAIATFPSDLFYGGKLLNGVSPPERRPLPGFPWPREEFPVAFLPVPEGIEVDDGVSKMNEAEANAACDAVHMLLDAGCSVSDVAVVTPYAAQVRLIKRMTRQLVSRPPYVEVSSVDGFQGREKEAVIFSAVRSNDHGSVGFVSDWRRVNVSFTRARRALIVIGNDVCLRRGDVDTWSPWISWADSQGINMNFPGKPRGRYDAEQLRRVRGGTTAAEMLKDVLERQQAQLKTAEVELKRANKNTRNVVKEFEGGQGDIMGENRSVAIEPKGKEIKLVGNFESNWDDSDSEDDREGGEGGGDDWETGGLMGLEAKLKKTGLDLGDDEEEESGLRDAWDD